MTAHDFLVNLALVLGVAAVAAAVCRSLRQPPVLGYLLAGLVVGPHTPLPLFADLAMVQSLSELGVILLMFSIGIELSMRKLARIAGVVGPAAAVEMSLTGLLGLAAARLLGWDPLTSAFAGAMVAISSTMVIARTFSEEGMKGRFTQVVLGILVFEDLTAIVLITVLTAVASGAGVSAGQLLGTLGGLGAFLVGVAVAGVLVVPRAVRAVARLGSDETTLVFSVGLCFAMALLAAEAGFSVALGAFVAGALVAESGEAHAIEGLIVPLQNLFSAIFFVSVGMLIDPAALWSNLGSIALFTVVVLVGKILGVTFGSILSGNDVRRAVRAALSLAQVGEFSFIIVGVGLTYGVVSSDLMAVAVAVSAITAFTTPYLVRASNGVALLVDRHLPERLSTLVTLYGSWLDQLRSQPTGPQRSRIRRVVRRIAIDVVSLLSLGFLAETIRRYALAWLHDTFGLSPNEGLVLLLVAGALVASPFLVGLMRNALKLGRLLAEEVLPPRPADELDTARAPRLALMAVLQSTVVAVVCLPVAAGLQSVLPAWAVLPMVFLLVAFLGAAVWRQSRDLHGHVSAGAEVVLEALVRQLPDAASHDTPEELEEAQALLPGLGQLAVVRVTDSCWCAGKTLEAVGLHGWTGASLVALHRGEHGIANPGPEVRLQGGDVLVLLGPTSATDAARHFLLTGADPAPDRPRVSERGASPGPAVE